MIVLILHLQSFLYQPLLEKEEQIYEVLQVPLLNKYLNFSLYTIEHVTVVVLLLRSH